MVSTFPNFNRTKKIQTGPPQGLGTLVDHVGSKMFHLPPGIHFFNQQDFGAENFVHQIFIHLQLTICAAHASKIIPIPWTLPLVTDSIQKNPFRALVTGLSIRLKRSRLTSLVMGSKSTNLGLWGNPSTSSPGMSGKHTQNASPTRLTPWDDITQIPTKSFFPTSFLGSTCWKISQFTHWAAGKSTKELLELVACTFAHQISTVCTSHFSVSKNKHISKISTVEQKSNQQRHGSKKPWTFPIYPKKEFWTIYIHLVLTCEH